MLSIWTSLKFWHLVELNWECQTVIGTDLTYSSLSSFTESAEMNSLPLVVCDRMNVG